jgi:protein SCO1/2
MAALPCLPVLARPRLLLPRVSTSLALIVGTTILLGCSSGGSPDNSPSRGLPRAGFEGAAFPPGVRAHDFTLSNQRGDTVSLSAHRGRVVALAFVSSTCRACALVAQQVRGALDELGGTSGVRVLFVSTDPRADSRAHVRHFLTQASLTARVEYLTGSETRLRAVWHAYRIAPASAGKAQAEAAVTVLLIDRSGTERVGFGLEQITPEGIAHDIRLLQAD